MSFSNSDNKKGLFTEINITPLTDIFLVLLIIMMVIAPSFQSVDKDINIPEINSGVSIEHKNAEVSVTKYGEYFLNGRPISSNNLVNELTDLKTSIEKPEVVVKADKDTKSSEIQNIMKAAQEAQYEKLVIAGEPLTKKEQKKLQDNASTASKTKQQNQVSPPSKNKNYDWDE